MNWKSWRLWIIGLVLAALVAGDVLTQFAFAQDLTTVVTAGEPVHLAQAAPRKKRRTLMDLLFGDKQQQQQQQRPQVAPQVQVPIQQSPQSKPKPRKTPVARAPVKPKVEKSADATRVAVFGDSLAGNLADGLNRFYSEDPDLVVIDKSQGASGFVRQDYFDWSEAVAKEIQANSFDLAVVIIGVNDRQNLKADGESYKPFSDEWNKLYAERLNAVTAQLRAAGKPAIWVGLPPVKGGEFNTALTQISAMQRLASFSGGAEFLDIYDKFADENGKYTSYGPDVNGQRVRMREEDGIHFSNAGADKLAFYLSQSIKLFYRGGGVGIAIADPLAGTDAAAMVRPPYQGLGQTRLLEVAGAVIPLSNAPPRASDLLTADASIATSTPFDLDALIKAPVGRADAFGVGIDPTAISHWLP